MCVQYPNDIDCPKLRSWLLILNRISEFKFRNKITSVLYQVKIAPSASTSTHNYIENSGPKRIGESPASAINM